MKTILSRLMALEVKRPAPLMVTCRMPDGGTAVVDVATCIQARGDPIRTQGNNLRDALHLLDYMAGPNCVIN